MSHSVSDLYICMVRVHILLGPWLRASRCLAARDPLAVFLLRLNLHCLNSVPKPASASCQVHLPAVCVGRWYGTNAIKSPGGQQHGNVGHTAATGCIYESIHNQPGPGAALHFRFRSSKLATDLVPDPTQKDGVSPREQKASRSCPNKAQNSRGLHRAGCPVYSRLRMLRLSAAKP